MNALKRIVSYSPYLLILLVVLPVFSQAQVGEGVFSIKYVLWVFVNNVFGFLIGAAGTLLDFAVNNYVIGFGDTWGIGGSGVGGAIDMSWVIVRDVFNITFIFGLVWLGFKMILRSDDSSTRRTLITLIMAALLVNFSLFITKFVVDFTNILATEIAGAFSDSPADPAQVSSAFMQLFGLQTTWQFAGSGADGPTNPGDVSYSYIFGTAIVFMIGAFTFAAGGIMLIIRFAALCIYMVFSPLMFLGWVFPGLQGVSKKYWSGFLGRAFYAPAYLMLIYLAAFVMGSYNSTASGFKNALSGDQFDTVAATIGPFMLTCVFLIASVVVAGKMSADGANTAIKLGNNIRGRAQKGVRNAAMFAPRRVARGTAGATANVARRMDNRLLSSDTKFAKYGRGSLAAVGLDSRTRNNLIESGRNAKMGTSYSTADNEKNRLEQQKRRNQLNDERGRTEAYGENLTPALFGDGKVKSDALNKITGSFAKMSMEEMSKVNPIALKMPAVAALASDAKVKEMAESGYYSNEFIKEFKDAREVGTFKESFEALENAETSAEDLTSALDELSNTVRGFSKDRIENLSDKKISDQRIATSMTESQFETAMKSETLTNDKKDMLQKARNTGFANIAEYGLPMSKDEHPMAARTKDFKDTQRAKLFSKSAQDAGKIPAKVFALEEAAEHITPAALQQRMRNGLSEVERSAIEANIRRYITLQTPKAERAKQVWKKWANGNNTEGNQFDFDTDIS
jgi:hypothetical protein